MFLIAGLDRNFYLHHASKTAAPNKKGTVAKSAGSWDWPVTSL